MCMGVVTHCNLKHTNSVVGKHLLVSHGDLKWPKPLGSTVWPVLLTLRFASLDYVGYHNNGGGFLLPYQVPEMNQGCGQWT